MVHIAEGPFTFEKRGHHGVIPACGVYFALIMVPAATNKEVMFKYYKNTSTNYKI